MTHRSWLIAPANSEKKLSLAPGTGADVIVIDLTDQPTVEEQAEARTRAAEWLLVHQQTATQNSFERWVRINTLTSCHWREDLKAVLHCRPHGIVLPNAVNPETVRQLAAELYEMEQDLLIAPGSTRILPFIAETPATALTISSFAEITQPRMIGIGWNQEPLAKAIGSTRMRDNSGGLTDVFRFTRAQALLAAHSCGLMAIEAIQPNLISPAHVKTATEESRSDGFTGMLARHPAQVAGINAAFKAPTPDFSTSEHTDGTQADNTSAFGMPIRRSA